MEENLTKENEEKIKIECASRGWKYNAFTAYLIENHMNASITAYLMGCSKATVYHWLYMETLPSAVNFIFLMARKMRMMGKDLFAYV